MPLCTPPPKLWLHKTMFEHVTYKELAARHGKRPAFNLLCLVERLAQIRNKIASIDLETRFQQALKVLSETNFAA